MKKKLAMGGVALLVVGAAVMLLEGQSGPPFTDVGVGPGPRRGNDEVAEARLRGRTEEAGNASEKPATTGADGAFDIRLAYGAGGGHAGGGDPWRRGWTDGSDKPWQVTGEPSTDPDHGVLRVVGMVDSGAMARAARVRVEERVGPRREQTKDVRLALPGEATATPLLPGKPTVQVELGQLTRRLSLEIQAGLVTQLEVAFAPGARVSGQVRHVLRGPLPDVRLRLERFHGAWLERVETVTTAGGRYRLDDVPPGRWVIHLSGGAAGDHFRPRGVLTMIDTAPVEHEIVVGVVALRGTVRDASTGGPIAGARFHLGDIREVCTSTDARGTYALADIPGGHYPVRVEKHGFVVWAARVEIQEGISRTLDVDLEPAARLQLLVRDTRGRPVNGRLQIGVTALDGGPVAAPFLVLLLDAEGRARCRVLPPGYYELALEAPGCAPKTVRADLSVSGGVVDVVLERTEAAGGVSLRGRVTDALSGRPVAGAMIRATGGVDGIDFTDDAGGYLFRGLDAPSCRLLVTKDGYGYRRLEDIELDADTTKVLHISLTPAATLHVHAEDADGRPVTGPIMMTARPAEGTDGTRYGTAYTADLHGHFECRRLVPGPYTLRFDKEDVGAATLEVVLVAGENSLQPRLE